MEITKNWREFILIALGLLVILTRFVVVDTLFGWANVVLGAAIVLIAAWPFFPKKKHQATV